MEIFLSEWIHCGVLLGIDEGKLLIGWGKRKWLNEQERSKPSFYFPDYFLEDPMPWFQHEYYLEITVEEMLFHLSSIESSSKQDHQWFNSYKKFFKQNFNDLQKKIATGELQKAVPFIIESSKHSMSKVQLVQSVKSLLRYASNNQVYLYGFWDEGEGILGASPEVLFRYDIQGVLQTMACAGTRNIEEDNQILLSDPKELNEHELVVKGIFDSLSPYGKVSIGDLQLLKLSHLVHLVTPISIQLQTALLFKKIVEVLHPTPAVGAFPKKEGALWLENYQQKINRHRFGAPVGYFFPEKKQSNCYVAIRNVQWNHAQMEIAAGCGVVADSECEKEWAEIQLKLKAVKEMLAL